MPDLSAIPVGGTSLQGHIDISYHQLVEIFGEPTYVGNVDDKVRCEWIIEFYNEDEDSYGISTIYDWKEEFNTPIEWVREWHIGGFNSHDKFNVYEAVAQHNERKISDS